MFDVSESDCGECSAGILCLQLNGVIIQHCIKGIVHCRIFTHISFGVSFQERKAYFYSRLWANYSSCEMFGKSLETNKKNRRMFDIRFKHIYTV